MGAKRQGRRTARRAVSAINELTLLLGSVELEPVASLRGVGAPLLRLSSCIGLFEMAKGPEAAEVAPLRSIKRQLRPLIEIVANDDVVPPPFSPDVRQRTGFAIAQLLAMARRLESGEPRLKSKVVRLEADLHLSAFIESWAALRIDPSLENLSALHSTSGLLADLYYAVGVSSSEPRVKRLAKLQRLLGKATDRNGDIDEVPALLREVTAIANQLCRPTLAEHRAWIDSVR